ncbi:MAG: hypothetical protein SWK76_03980 [Actinomycetota bacterium]|nr:hypothetical protein [Actinomycetota bacterium]
MESQKQGGSKIRAPARKIFRSFFTKKLERKFEEKEMDIPQRLINLMDVPFEQFTVEDKDLYENQLKPLAYVFAEHLAEIYEVMGRPRRGWEEMLDRIDPSPIKVWATLVIHEEDKVQAMPEPIEIVEEAQPAISSQREKYSVRAYPSKEDKRERWWEKKIF